jgi:hypothetical protein
VRRALPIAGLVVAVVASGCGGSSSQTPYFDDARFLRFGVNPFDEADTLARQFEDAGSRVPLKVRGQYFSAFGVVDARGRPSAVRVVTARGVELALDSREAGPLEDALAYRLLPSPIAGTQDVDGDGFEEVLIERWEGALGHGCIELHRVRDVGFVDPVALPDRALGEPACVESARDVDGDGKAELLFVVRLLSLGRAGARAPELPLVLWAVEHRFEVRPPAGALAAELLSLRQGAIELARMRGDSDSVYRLAFELALLTALTGADAASRRAKFDQLLGDALAGSESVVRARAFLDGTLPPLAEWPEAPVASDSPATP